MVPYLPSLYEMRRIIQTGNASLSSGSPYMRSAMLATRTGWRRLSIPLEGGGRKKRENWEHTRVSEHGNWRHIHLQAIASEYGRLPYFEHIYPLLQDALNKDNLLLETICRKAFEAMTEIGMPEISSTTVPKGVKEDTRNILSSCYPLFFENPEASALPAIMLLGRRSVLLL